MNRKRAHVTKQTIERISDREREYVAQVLETNFRTSSGATMCNALEKDFAERHGVGYAISFINGTSTMHAALVAAGVGPGDEVIVPPLTMSSTTFVVLQAGAVPVFADVDPNTFQIDPASVSDRVTEYTKAIITVALYGLSPDMDAIMNIASQHDLTVIEDDAETMFSTWKGRLVGTLGHMASFSFQSTKHLTSGEGGMLITDDADLALKARQFNSLGYAGLDGSKGKITKNDIQDPGYARHVSHGYNYRMPELCAAVMRGQFERAEELIQRRIDAAKLFIDAIGGCNWLQIQSTPENCRNTYWTLAARLISEDFSWHTFRDTFRANGGDGIYAAWRLTYLEPMFADGCPVQHPDYKGTYQNFGPGLCPNAEMIQPQMLQFKTDYWDWSEAERQADILAQTIKQLGG